MGDQGGVQHDSSYDSESTAPIALSRAMGRPQSCGAKECQAWMLGAFEQGSAQPVLGG
jgi:hypothetical protein